jgi:hypothetical protein
VGFFKDIRDLKKQAMEVQESTGQKRPGLRESLSQANSAMAEVQGQLDSQQHLNAHGTATTAVIEAIRPTDTLVNHLPVIEYDLRLQQPDGEALVMHRQATPHASLARLTPGASIGVLVDPADPHKVTLLLG